MNIARHARPGEERPVFVIRLRPEKGVDGHRALRAVLKVLLRRFGLRAVSAVAVSDGAARELVALQPVSAGTSAQLDPFRLEG
jgi:hypothetical protein